MNTPFRIVAINGALAVALALLFSFGNNGHFASGDFMILLGICCLGIAVLDILIAIVLFLTGQENYAAGRGFLLSGGILLLAGFAVCSAAFQGI
ncbi:MAG: hypothetical protein U0X40_01995 [Ferruginibacter sp.]